MKKIFEYGGINIYQNGEKCFIISPTDKREHFITEATTLKDALIIFPRAFFSFSEGRIFADMPNYWGKGEKTYIWDDDHNHIIEELYDKNQHRVNTAIKIRMKISEMINEGILDIKK